MASCGAHPVRVVAGSDCEAIRDGWITQPVNAASSLAYVAAGATVWARHRGGPHPRRARVLGGVLAGVGLGSVAYHGPGGVAARWAHDAGIVAAAAVLAEGDGATALGRTTPGRAVEAATLLVAAGLSGPRTTTGAQAVAGAAVAVADAAAWRRAAPGSDERRRRAAVTALLGGGALLHALGRTGGPLCRPASRWQAHAAWHVLSAVALGLVADEQLRPK